MEVSILAKRGGDAPEECFMIDANNGKSQIAEIHTSEQERSYFVSQLQLFEEVGKSAQESVVDEVYLKSLAYKDSASSNESTQSKTGVDHPGETSVSDAFKTSLIEAQKAAAELTHLVQLTNLIRSNEALGLYPIYPPDEAEKLATAGAQNVGVATLSSSTSAIPSTITQIQRSLPLVQRIQIYRSSLHNAKLTLSKGYEASLAMIEQRQRFAEQLAVLQQQWKLRYVDGHTGKIVKARKYNAQRDYIAIDCAPFADVFTGRSSSTGGEVSLDSHLIPLHMSAGGDSNIDTSSSCNNNIGSNSGISLTSKEQARTFYSLQASLLRTLHTIGATTTTANASASNGGKSTDTTVADATGTRNSSAYVVACKTLWDVLSTTSEPTSTSISDSGNVGMDTTTSSTSSGWLSVHCQRRQHEAVCRSVLKRLQQDCNSKFSSNSNQQTTSRSSAVIWDILADAARTVGINEDSNSQYVGDNANDNSASDALLLSEKLTRGLKVVARSEDSSTSLTVRLSDSFLLSFKLVPIPAVAALTTTTNTSIVDVVAAGCHVLSDPEVSSCIQDALVRLLVAAQLSSLAPSRLFSHTVYAYPMVREVEDLQLSAHQRIGTSASTSTISTNPAKRQNEQKGGESEPSLVMLCQQILSCRIHQLRVVRGIETLLTQFHSKQQPAAPFQLAAARVVVADGTLAAALTSCVYDIVTTKIQTRISSVNNNNNDNNKAGGGKRGKRLYSEAEVKEEQREVRVVVLQCWIRATDLVQVVPITTTTTTTTTATTNSNAPLSLPSPPQPSSSSSSSSSFGSPQRQQDSVLSSYEYQNERQLTRRGAMTFDSIISMQQYLHSQLSTM